MKKSSKQRGRSYGRNNNNNNYNKNYNVNSCFDSNGPGGRIRGNASQIVEKYLLMARDANSQNDRVLAENFYQYAEHYNRIINSFVVEVRNEPRPHQEPKAIENQEVIIEAQEEAKIENEAGEVLETKEAPKEAAAGPLKSFALPSKPKSDGTAAPSGGGLKLPTLSLSFGKK